MAWRLDTSRLRVHADTPVEAAPAFVTNQDLFFAPGIYGVDSPESLKVLDAAIRAALTGLLGVVGGEPAQVVPPAPPPGGAARRSEDIRRPGERARGPADCRSRPPPPSGPGEEAPAPEAPVPGRRRRPPRTALSRANLRRHPLRSPPRPRRSPPSS